MYRYPKHQKFTRYLPPIVGMIKRSKLSQPHPLDSVSKCKLDVNDMIWKVVLCLQRNITRGIMKEVASLTANGY